jgi:NAD+ kinase
MKTLAIVANCSKARAPAVVARVCEKARLVGLSLCSDPETARLCAELRALDRAELFDAVDAVMALGGDGTMLRAVRQLDGRDKPVIGVNLGGLGFLTSIAEQELDRALECLARGLVEYYAHAIAECRVVRNGEVVSAYRALNDVVITRGASPRVITLDVSINGDAVTSYMCDGLIVATPAGSTGHSLSAGGPILVPGTDAFVVNLICPHTLSSRALVVSDRSRIAVVVRDGEGQQALSVDGQVGQALEHGDCVTVQRSDRSVRFIHLPGYSYYAVLRQKLHWSGSSI